MARDEGTRAVLVPESEPVKVEATRPRLRTGRRLIGDGLVEIPIHEDVEPASAVLTNPVLSEQRDVAECVNQSGHEGITGANRVHHVGWICRAQCTVGADRKCAFPHRT
jgi:serine/threonine-protein kinase PknG